MFGNELYSMSSTPVADSDQIISTSDNREGQVIAYIYSAPNGLGDFIV